MLRQNYRLISINTTTFSPQLIILTLNMEEITAMLKITDRLAIHIGLSKFHSPTVEAANWQKNRDCIACVENQPNQMAHMGLGVCLEEHKHGDIDAYDVSGLVHEFILRLGQDRSVHTPPITEEDNVIIRRVAAYAGEEEKTRTCHSNSWSCVMTYANFIE